MINKILKTYSAYEQFSFPCSYWLGSKKNQPPRPVDDTVQSDSNISKTVKTTSDSQDKDKNNKNKTSRQYSKEAFNYNYLKPKILLGNKQISSYQVYNYPSLGCSGMQQSIKQQLMKIQKDPTNVMSYFDLGYIYLKIGKSKESINCFQKVLQIENPKVPQADSSSQQPSSQSSETPSSHERTGPTLGTLTRLTYFLLSFALEHQQQYQKSIEYLNKLLKFYPKNEKFNKKIAFTYYRMGQVQKSIQAFNKFLSLNAKDDKVYSFLGQLHYKRGDFQKAIDYYKKASKLEPEKQSYKIKIGFLHLELEKYEEAINFFNNAISNDPKKIQAYNGLSAVYLKMNKISQYLQVIQNMLRLSPENPLFIAQRIHGLQIIGLSAQALAQAQNLHQKHDLQSQWQTTQLKKKFHLTDDNIKFIKYKVSMVKPSSNSKPLYKYKPQLKLTRTPLTDNQLKSNQKKNR